MVPGAGTIWRGCAGVGGGGLVDASVFFLESQDAGRMFFLMFQAFF